MRVVLGMVVTLAGFLIAMLGLVITASIGGRLVLTLIGIAVSLTGIMGVINRAYLKNAIWKN